LKVLGTPPTGFKNLLSYEKGAALEAWNTADFEVLVLHQEDEGARTTDNPILDGTSQGASAAVGSLGQNGGELLIPTSLLIGNVLFLF